ncbi:hypothetical protein EVAR_34649_1 [Eumeta japonica]|uniref:Uncharacterized protein n=1 Tax=Eumeta variegata TaxID=151549 RepID=A0A4C1VGZ5_EUMVA|nr:hypothetical protein EVAR_34649_1 [Eumeta japonica]
MMAWPREKHKGKESTFAVVLKVLQLVLFTAVVTDVAAYAYKYQREADFTTRGQLYIVAISGVITLVKLNNFNSENFGSNVLAMCKASSGRQITTAAHNMAKIGNKCG